MFDCFCSRFLSVYRGMHGQIVEKEDMFYTIILWFGVNCVKLQ